MIKSILQKHTDPVILHNIRTADDIITEPDKIKEKVREHFINWTKLNSTQTNLWQDWKDQYEPIYTIQHKWYNNLTSKITLTEMDEIIKEAPCNKATGPTKISNEMLKHLDLKAKSLLLKILNDCITLQDISKA